MHNGHLITGLLDNTVEKYPDYPAVRWIVKKQISEKLYRELNEDRNKVAGALLKMGFEGKQAAMIGTSSYEWIVSYLGIVSTKITAVPLDPMLPPPELCDLINRSDSEVLTALLYGFLWFLAGIPGRRIPPSSPLRNSFPGKTGLRFRRTSALCLMTCAPSSLLPARPEKARVSC